LAVIKTAMDGKGLYERVMVIFGGVMVFFYLGIGLLFIFHPLFDNIHIGLRIIFGSALILYSIARAFRTYEKVKETFFSINNSDQ
jgi:cytochrome c biogenesis protein CcdA